MILLLTPELAVELLSSSEDFLKMLFMLLLVKMNAQEDFLNK
jgi:hypothetical protein